MTEVATITFSGRLDTGRFLEFADHRARRLDLRLRFDEADDAGVTVTVTGQPDLIDAFEMACSLGPADCMVLEVTTHVGAERGSNG